MASGARLQLVAMDGSQRLFLVDTAVESSNSTGGGPGKAGPVMPFHAGVACGPTILPSGTLDSPVDGLLIR